MNNHSTTVGIITFDHAHLKTEQLIGRLFLKGRLAGAPRLDLKILALPFLRRPERRVLFEHRPDQHKSVFTRELARCYGLEFLPCNYDSIPDVADYYLVGGAGLLSAQAIGKKKILNAHPGIIPSARGLDAFKWSILNQVPLGVSLHYLDAEVDAGETIAIFETPIFPDDDLMNLARRHYELEVDALCEFLAVAANPMVTSAQYPLYPARMRMPVELERDMIEGFPAYKEKFCARSLIEWKRSMIHSGETFVSRS